MTKEEAKLVLDNARPQTKEIDRQFYDDEDLNNALDLAIKALEQPTSDDCVSRQAVIDAVENTIAEYIPTFIGRYEKIPLELALAIKDMPPVTPTFPKGVTNGDVIKAMFDCQEDEKQWGNDNIWVTFKAKNNPSHNFDLDWWNAPYKRGNENG